MNLFLFMMAFLFIVFEFQGIDDIDIEDDKREIIHREIKSFRDLHKVGILRRQQTLLNCFLTFVEGFLMVAKYFS